MKTVKRWTLLSVVIGLLLSCDHDTSIETVVHPDGSLDRTIVLERADSSDLHQNYFGIGKESGWEIEVSKKSDSAAVDNHRNLVIRFEKHFSSSSESNQELSSSIDTLFKITANFEKKFRWFYTYLYYSDTYGAIDRFNDVSQEDFFSQEDYAFIKRLPAEGKQVSKADNLYLEHLNEKIYDQYAMRNIFEDQFSILSSLIERHELDQRWLDTLNVHKEPIYSVMLENQDGIDGAIDNALDIADSLSIPLPRPQADRDFEIMSKKLEPKLQFMSYANDSKYTHSIRMPWTMVRTNADSIIDNQLIWQPPVTKFLLKDYEMYAEARKMNYWAVIVSAIIVALTLYLIVRKK